MMRNSLDGVKARVERLTAQCRADAEAPDWDKLVARFQSARTNPGPRMSEEAWQAMKPRLWAQHDERKRQNARRR